jgi:hypothetical protein
MKTLTVSELNQILISKGFQTTKAYSLPINKWGADEFWFTECKYTGTSTINLSVKTSPTTFKIVTKYRKFKAADKKEFAKLVLGI